MNYEPTISMERPPSSITKVVLRSTPQATALQFVYQNFSPSALDVFKKSAQEQTQHKATEQYASLHFFDFSTHKDLEEQVLQVEQITKNYLARRRMGLGLQLHDFGSVRPYYVTNGNTPGFVDEKTGIVVVHFGNPPGFEVGAKTIAHELSHASAPLLHYYKRTAENNYVFDELVHGLARHPNVRLSNLQPTGDFLENGMALIDESEVYEELQHLPMMQNHVAQAKKRVSAPLEWMQSETRYTEQFKADLTSRISAAKQLGVPEAWIMSYIVDPDKLPENLLQTAALRATEGRVYDIDGVVIMWKLARVLGKSANRNLVDSGQLVEKGRKMLETSRYKGTNDVHRKITELFQAIGKDPKSILLVDQHPTAKEYREILEALRLIEQSLGIPPTEHGEFGYHLY